MTLVIPPGYGLVVHSLSLSGDPDPYAITYGVKTTGADLSEGQSLVNDLHTAYHTNINPENASLLTLVETTLKWIPTGEVDPLVNVATTPHAGAGGSAALVPQNTALLVHKRTGRPGRTGRGRMYFPALNEANVGPTGEITAGWVGSMNVALADWLGDIETATVSDGMYLLHDSTGAGAALDPFEVTALATDTLAATQRRRLRH